MRLGFVGLGNMGGPMATNLHKAGHQLVVTDLRREVAADLEAGGATWSDTAAGVATDAEAVLLSLPTPADVEGVVSGLLETMVTGQTIIDLSTNSPAVVRQLWARARERGIGFLDAPVSGGVRGARNATLAVMVGADEDQFATFQPVLSALGPNIFHTGPVGSGNVAKLVNNQLAFISMMATTEALVLGAKAGIDPVILRDIVRTSSGNSFAFDSGSRAILRDRLAPTFSCTLAAKDIGLAQDLATEFEVDAPMGKRARELIDAYRDNGFAAEDVLATVKAVEEQAGFQVRGTWRES
jgi:3-hydroxyisobutyrate dehydrogenase-like beta-hydroxyacid dehydrogenase